VPQLSIFKFQRRFLEAFLSVASIQAQAILVAAKVIYRHHPSNINNSSSCPTRLHFSRDRKTLFLSSTWWVAKWLNRSGNTWVLASCAI
jgi:hypothetical protein